MNAPDRAEFLARRKAGIGGTDISALLGLNPWRSAVDVWREKTGRAAPTESALRLRYGIEAEAFIAREYEAETGRKTVRHTGLLVHDDYPMCIGNLDRLIVPEGAKVAAHQGEIRTTEGLEIKTVSGHALRGDEWGQPGSDQVPGHYLLQCQWYMALSPITRMDLAALVGAGEELRIYTLRQDRDLQQELLRRASEWWRAYVIADVAPPPQSEADVLALFPKDNQREIEADDNIAQLAGHPASLKAQIKTLEDLEQDARDQITAYLGEAAVLRYQGATLATWKAARDGSKTDWKGACKAAGVPESVIADYTTATTGSRRLILK